MSNEPLKGKGCYDIPSDKTWFVEEDVKSAVEWLKEEDEKDYKLWWADRITSVVLFKRLMRNKIRAFPDLYNKEIKNG